jgi:hypothetical protein
MFGFILNERAPFVSLEQLTFAVVLIQLRERGVRPHRLEPTGSSVGGPSVARLTQATARLGTLFLYGALSAEPTPLPLMEFLGKWLTIRGYVMLEITSDPKRLKRGKQFINEGLAEGSLSRSSPRRSRLKRSSRLTAIWSRASRSVR